MYQGVSNRKYVEIDFSCVSNNLMLISVNNNRSQGEIIVYRVCLPADFVQVATCIPAYSASIFFKNLKQILHASSVSIF